MRAPGFASPTYLLESDLNIFIVPTSLQCVQIHAANEIQFVLPCAASHLIELNCAPKASDFILDTIR